MESNHISPWIKTTNPIIDDSGYSNVVLTKLDNGITLLARWNGKVWWFQNITDNQISFIPLPEVNVVNWMYIPE